MLSSINRMMHVACATICALVLISGTASIWASRKQADALDRMSEASALLRNHMTADMMHDAVRGDVLSILASQGQKEISLSESRKSLEDDAALLRKSVATDKAYVGSALVTDAAGRIVGRVDSYIRAAQDIAAAAEADPARAAAIVPRFLEDSRLLRAG